MTTPDRGAEILRLCARELVCNGDNVRALLAQLPGAADALLTAAAQKLDGAVDDDPDGENVPQEAVQPQESTVPGRCGAATPAGEEEEP